MKYVNKVISDTKALASSLAEESFANIRTVKAFATENQETISFFKANEVVYEAEINAGKAFGFFQFLANFVIFATLDALLYFAAFLVRHHGFDIGRFATF